MGAASSFEAAPFCLTELLNAAIPNSKSTLLQRGYWAAYHVENARISGAWFMKRRKFFEFPLFLSAFLAKKSFVRDSKIKISVKLPLLIGLCGIYKG